MTFDELCRAVHQVTGEIGHVMPYELVQQTVGDELVREAEKQRVRTRRRKKTCRPPVCVPSRPSDGLEQDMSREPDPFWKASEAAWKRLGELQQQDLPQAMDWLRQSQPVAYRQLTHDWLERIAFLWASRELTAFEEALDTWVVLHVEVCATYKLVRALQKR